MFEIFKRAIYVLLALSAALYAGSYLVCKVPARAERRRGYALFRFGSIGYPYFKLQKYLSKETNIILWDVLLFIFSLLIWSTVPLTGTLVIMDISSGFFVSAFFYLAVLVLLVLASESKYEFQLSNTLRKAGMAWAFFLPALFSFLAIMLLSRTVNMKEIVSLQFGYWNIVYQPLGFFIVLACTILLVKTLGLTRKNITLFSNNQQRQGSGLSKAIGRFAKYMAAFYLVALINIFYLGGWLDLYFIDGNIMLVIKFFLVFIVVLLFDKAIPDVDNYKYLVDINLKFLIPVSVFNLVLTLGFLSARNIFGWV